MMSIHHSADYLTVAALMDISEHAASFFKGEVDIVVFTERFSLQKILD
jgi:hypothetical protein